jgi:RHS repeat-associated protein
VDLISVNAFAWCRAISTPLRGWREILACGIAVFALNAAAPAQSNRSLDEDEDDVEVIVQARIPKVAVATPGAGVVFQAPISASNPIALTATARSRRSTISGVAFYEGTTLIGNAALTAGTNGNGTYSFTWTTAPTGNRNVWARATSSLGGIGSSLVRSFIVNAQPNVNVLIPTSGQVVLPGQTITLTAAASDSDDSISRVDFLINGANIGASTGLGGGQYTRSWTATTGGNFTAAATALDSRGGTTTASPVSFVVNIPPIVTLASAPANIATVNTPVTLTATATDSDGTIANVQFFVDGASVSPLITSATSGANYVFTWSPTQAKVYSITAVATDNRGTATTSTALSFTSCGFPQVAITAPTANQLFVVPAAVPTTATATQPQGACGPISKVEFFNGSSTTALSTINAPTGPYAYSWAGLTGNATPYTLRVRATDAGGRVSNPDASVSFVMNSPPLTAITTVAPLVSGVVTVTPLGPVVTVTATASDSDGTVGSVQLFDGATAVGTALTLPNAGANFAFPWSPTTVGVHALTTKAKDNRTTETTSAITNVTVCGAPTLNVTSPTANQYFAAPATIALSSTASQPTAGCGTISKVEYFNDTVATATTPFAIVNTAVAGAYPFSWANLAGRAGSYKLRVRVTDSRLLTTETTVNFVVNALPTVSISAPANAAVLDVGTASTITVAAADSDGSLSKIEFLDGTTVLNTLTNPAVAPSYSYSWIPSTAGNHTLTVRVTDDRTGVTTSTVVTVNACAIPTVTLTSPTAGANFAPIGAATTTSIALAAAAPVPAAGCGTISNVSFSVNGGASLGSDTSAPYTFNHTGVAKGTYSYVATVTTSRNKTGTSTPVVVTVNKLPSVTLVAACSTTPCNPPATINLTATPTDPDGTIAKVEFFNSANQKVGEKLATAPWTFAVPNLPSGTGYTFTAKATDDLLGTGTSAATAAIRVNAPPANVVVNSGTCSGATTCQAPIAITLSATATDDVSVTKLEFYTNNNTQLLGLATKSGSNWVWTGTDYVGGISVVTAKAYDGDGLSTFSPAFSINVAAPITVAQGVGCGSDSANSRLGQPQPVVVPIDVLCQGVSQTLTFLSSVTNYSGTVAKIEYCNGVNANGSCVVLLGSSTSGPNYSITYQSGPTQYLIASTAVAYAANGTVLARSAPTNVTINPQPVFTSFTAICSANPCKIGDTVTLTATATDANGGTISRVRFSGDDATGINDTVAPFTTTFTILTSGPHNYLAQAVDNQGGVGQSVAAVSVPVPPTIQPDATVRSVVPGGTATIDVIALDDGAGLKTEIFFDGATTATKTCITQASGAVCTGTWLAPATPVVARLVPVKIVVTDAAGLSVTETRFVAITLDPNATLVDYEAPLTSTLGTTAGALQITDSGAATYSIPIAVPPGVNGMQPDIALAYSSQGGDGFLGVGWSMTGYSAITRCPKTYAQDGVREGIKYDGPATDAYCLDGQRLIPVSVNKNPITGTVEYRTEIDSYSKIESFPADQNQFAGIGSWKVWAKSGRVFDFGSNYKILSRGLGQASVRANSIKVWPIDRVTDRFGNYITYEYQSTNADTFFGTAAFRGTGATTAIAPFPFTDYWPSRILTYNASGEPLGDVVLDSEARGNGQETFFDSGAGETRLSKRLRRILVRAHDGTTLTAVRSYLLNYNTSAGSNRPNLAGVQECFGDVTTADPSCMAKTSFEWTTPVIGTEATFATSVSRTLAGNSITAKAADINGDGISDILSFRGSVTTAPPTYTCGESGTDLCGPSILDGFTWEQCLSNGLGGHTCSDVTFAYNDAGVNLWDPASYNLVDVDGDGYADLVLERRLNNTRRITICRGGPTGLSASRCWDNPVPATDNVLFQSQFADLNGDGRLDIVLFRAVSTSPNSVLIGIQKQDGTGFDFTTTGLGATDPLLDETDLAGKHGLLADMDGDGKIDIVRRASKSSSDPDYARWKTYFSDYGLTNTGAKLTPTVRFAEATADDPPNTHILDLNGDGLADFASWTQSGFDWKVCLSHGDGSFQFQDPEMKWILPTTTTPGYWQGAGTATYSADPAATNFVGTAPRCRTWSGLDLPAAKILWGDFNGDGRSDMAGIVKAPGNVNVLKVCTSTGTNFACTVWPTPAGVTLPNIGTNISDTLLAGDFNGDGRTDIAIKSASGAWVILYAGSGTPKPVDAITKITNGLGATTSLNYAPITSASVYTKGTASFSDTAILSSATTFDVQAPMYVVSQVTSSNATTTPLVAQYAYSGYRASTKRGPLGFKTKTITELQDTGLINTNIVTTTDFGDLSTDNWQIAGRPKSVTRTVGGTKVSESTYTWEARSHATGCSSGIVNVWQVMSTATAEISYEINESSTAIPKPYIGLPPRTTSAPMTSVDCYGNPKSVSISQDGYGQSKALTYENDATSWILGNATKSITTYSKAGLSNIVRTTEATYDPTTGVMKTQTIEPLTAGETSSPMWSKSTYGYASNQYGNRTSVTTQFYEGNSLVSRSSSAQYIPVNLGDPNYHGRFPVSTTNELDHTSKATYDVAFGNVVKATAPSGHYTQFAFDSFGRKTLETTFTPAGKRLAQSAYNLYAVTGYAYAIRSKSSGGTERRVFYDNLQRERKVETDVTTAVDSVGVSTVKTSTLTTDYDQYGRVTSASQPLASTGGTSTVKSTTNTYDKFNRAYVVTRQDNGATTSSWSTDGTTLTSIAVTTRAAASNEIKVQRVNSSLGWLKSVTEYDGNNGKATSYDYNAAGDMVTVTGPTGIQKQIEYDRLGRKTKLTDPDAGVHKYTYNGVGEIIKQTEGNATTVLRTTDNTYLNGRMTARVETDAGTAETLTTNWSFDSCDASLPANLTKGALCSVTTARAVGGTNDTLGAHARVFGFEPNTGRPFATRTIVNGKNYVTWSLADANSRPIVTGYPATSLGRALRLKHSYTSTGQLYNTTDATTNAIYWQADSRTLDGQTYKTQRGATTTVRGYDSAGRLSAIDTTKTAGATALYSASASFDYIGSVVARGLTVTGVTGAGYTDGFAYDGLNRLKTTTGSSAASYVYDDAGNLTNRGGGVDIAYKAGKHQACAWVATGTASCSGVATDYQYDDTGNFLTSPNHEASWNAFGAVHSVRAKTAINGATTNARLEWRYDGSHQRFLERSYTNATSNATANSAGTGTLVKTTLFVGAGFEEVQDVNASGAVTATTWRHLIASPEGLVAVVTHKSADTVATAPTIRHWHRDHLGSIVAITKEDGTLAQAFKYDPWGTRTQSTNPAGEATEERGYTTHETLAEIGLVHMNGRLYDPTIGRFLSADPIIQDATQSTSLNRYAYVLNNPMSYTDPSGFSWWSDIRDGFVKPGAAILFAWQAAGPILAAYETAFSVGFAANAATATTIGFASGGITGGSFEAAFKGAAGALVSFGLSELIFNLIPQAVHGLVEHFGASSAGTTGGLRFDRGTPMGRSLDDMDLRITNFNDRAAQQIAKIEIEGSNFKKLDPMVKDMIMGIMSSGGSPRSAAIAWATRAPMSTFQHLSAASTRAAKSVDPKGLTPQQYGTKVHTELERDIKNNLEKQLNVKAEVSYHNGIEVKRGHPGSVRLDVVEGGITTPTAVYDLKTGQAGLSASRITEIRSHLPEGYRNIPVIELRP